MAFRNDDPSPLALMTAAEADALAERIYKIADEPAVEVLVGSLAMANTQFARGDAHMVEETGGDFVQIIVSGCAMGTTRFDDEGLQIVLDQAREAARLLKTRDKPYTMKPQPSVPTRPRVFFDTTVKAQAAERRAELYRRALDATEAAGLIGAGDIKTTSSSGFTRNRAGLSIATPHTYGEFSLTARTKDGKGSGWGWSGHEDWSKVDADAVIHRAIELAQRSANPVAVEPGRYTVILEPTATAALIGGINFDAFWADQGMTVFSKLPLGTNKIGLQMMDQRLGLVSDPWDPALPHDLIDPWGSVGKKVDWFTHGILRELDYQSNYAEEKKRAPTEAASSHRYKLYGTGPTQTLDEMIASTKRGVWVNRLSGMFAMNGRTQLMSGTTRDGTFLIENGKITKAIKNFRFTESPFFVLNKLEAFGEPERASGDIVAPRLKVRDFDFTSLTDAI